MSTHSACIAGPALSAGDVLRIADHRAATCADICGTHATWLKVHSRLSGFPPLAKHIHRIRLVSVDPPCSLFNNILTPADLDDRASIFFFLEGVKPDWDEPETQNGGIWQVPVKQKGQEGKSKLEIYWADVVRAAMA